MPSTVGNRIAAMIVAFRLVHTFHVEKTLPPPRLHRAAEVIREFFAVLETRADVLATQAPRHILHRPHTAVTRWSEPNSSLTLPGPFKFAHH